MRTKPKTKTKTKTGIKKFTPMGILADQVPCDDLDKKMAAIIVDLMLLTVRVMDTDPAMALALNDIAVILNDHFTTRKCKIPDLYDSLEVRE